MNFEEYIMIAYSYLGKEINGYGKVEAITIYGENHLNTTVEMCQQISSIKPSII